jgi:hypothetical protein
VAGRKNEDVVGSVTKKISSMFKDGRSEETKLLDKRDRKRRNFRTHRRAYTVVILGIMLMNVLPLLMAGGAPLWAFFFWLFPALAWGMGFAMHGLSYRSWMNEHARELALAERKLGRLPAGAAHKALPPPKDVPVIEGVAIVDDEWRSILMKAKQAIARALEALDEAQHQQAGGEELKRQLSDGMSNIERLAAGAERITEALEEIAPDGGGHLEQEIEALDAKINDAGDDQLREVYHANRSLLVARKAKLEALDGERARMKANAEGFLIAAENVRLDIAGMGAGEKPRTTALVEPVRRLTEEVEILRKVEAELKQFS